MHTSLLFSSSIVALLLVSTRGSVGGVRRARPTEELGSGGLCVIGCTPYVDPTKEDHGILKYKALVEDMAEKCDVLVHVGDTKPGKMACNRTLMTNSVHILAAAAASKGKLALYSIGDNESCDCHRHGSEGVPSEIYKAQEARQYLIDDLNLRRRRDLTGQYRVIDHRAVSKKYGEASNITYDCAFNKYVPFDNYAVATLEVIGSYWYLGDEREEYKRQDDFDPLSSREAMYINARDCTLDWIQRTAVRASKENKRALFFMFHASFYRDNGKESLTGGPLIGNTTERPYQPLFDELTRIARRFPRLMFYCVHSDAHRLSTVRMNPTLNNRDLEDRKRYYSHHNMMIHQVEGSSRALTMFSRFIVDDSFQPVSHKQEWSQTAYDERPKGHSFVRYSI